MTYKLGLIGFHLTHSISAVIQKAGLESLGIEGSYEILETPPEDLISRIKFLKGNGYDGFNVTIPLKVPVALFLDHVDKYADIAGCVNVVKINPTDKSFYGYNTDIYGFKSAIPVDIQQRLKGTTVSILGTGGAARAVAVGLIELGVKEIDFYSRNIINSSTMVNYLRRTFPDTTFKLYQIEQIRDLSHTSMLVNTTPIGMCGHSMDQMPISYEAMKNLPTQVVVYDIIYNPPKTLLLQKVSEYGHETINGLDMLIHQAAKGLEIWTGRLPDIDKMKIAALESLQESKR